MLRTVKTRTSWEVLKTFMEEQKSNQTMPSDMRDVFFTDSPEKLLSLTKSPNRVIAALARSRVLYDGETIGLTKGTVEPITSNDDDANPI